MGFSENYGIILLFFHKTYEPRHEKTNFLVSDLLRHKPCVSEKLMYNVVSTLGPSFLIRSSSFL